MVRAICVLLLCGGVLFADALDDKVQNLLGEKSYQLNSLFLKRIFANKNMYYSGGRLDMAKIVYALKNNGLLTSRFGQPSEVSIGLSARTSPVLLTKIGNNILTTMGYSYFIVSRAEHSGGLSHIEFSFNTEHSPDMGILIDELGKRGFMCLDVRRVNAQKWEYTLEVNEPRLPRTAYIRKGGESRLRETSGEYWLNISQQGELTIQTVSQPKWNPRVVLYDKNLGIIDLIYDKSPTSSLKVRVPAGVKFIMITDYDSPESLKGGIAVHLR